MQPGSRRTALHSSRLVRLLAGLVVADPADPVERAVPAQPASPAIAQQLGQWLDWTDAIPLSAVLAGPAAAAGAAAPGAAEAVARPVRAALARVRADLTRAITSEAVFAPARPAAAAPEAAAPAEADAFAPYRRACQGLQRSMAARIAPLRQQVRAALAQASPALARLAALDAVMDEWLAVRERSLLAGVPTLLERRCERLRQRWPQDWPARLGPEVQDVLLAELDVRLQPVEGLIEALGQETL